MHPVRLQRIHVGGAPTHVHSGGEGDPPLLLLHGGWGDAELHWSPTWNGLAAHARVIAPDLPGLGDPNLPGLASVPDYVEWLADLLDTLSIDRAVCVGNALGASLAWSFAGRRPDRCAGVVLVDGGPLPHTPAPLAWLGRRPFGRALLGRVLTHTELTPKVLPKAFADPGCAPRSLSAQLEHPPRRRFETFLDCLIAGDGAPPPNAPVLIVWGADDRLPGARVDAGRRLAERIPGARLVVLDHAGHFPQLERPGDFVAAVVPFASDAR